MSINDLIINGGFETGSFPPWIPFNASITSLYTHSGLNAALLTGGTINSYIYQFVPINPGERYEFIVSLSKVGASQSPPISLSIPYYDADFNFIGYGLITNIPANRMTGVNGKEWLEIYQTTDPAPAGAVQALVLINKLPLPSSADVIVDDVSLLVAEGNGATGPTGPTGATGLLGLLGPLETLGQQVQPDLLGQPETLVQPG